jgi:hypothetical protein
VFGGLVALVFIAVSSAVKPLVPLLTLAPQVVWLAYIGHRSRVAGLDTW